MELNCQRYNPATLLPGKEPRYPLYRRLRGPQSRSGRGGEEKNSQPPPEFVLLSFNWAPNCKFLGG
jgi:hypothetical protein